MNSSRPARGGRIRPFTDSAIRYCKDGWSPIPVGRDKRPKVRGYHGSSGDYPDLVTVERWVRRYPSSNIAIRLPEDFIAIDVDAYAGKPGADTLAELERELGPLPETWISTARQDGVSGIRWYRIPGRIRPIAWPGTAGPGIDIIHWANRYVIVPPSVHPTGKRYRWNHPLSPIPEDLPCLPDEWVEGLPSLASTGQRAEPVHRGRSSTSHSALRAALREYGGGEPCNQLAGIADRAIGDIKAGASAHDAALNAVWGILRDWSIGHRGANSALRAVRSAFLAAPGPRARSRTALGEWQAMAHGIVLPAWLGGERPVDPCREQAGGLDAIRRMMNERKARNATR